MSIITALGEKFQNLPAILEQYDEDLADAERNIAIKGKTLEGANVEHASWMSYYDQRRVELQVLMKFFEQEVARVRGKLWKQYTENFDRELNTRDKENYINNEPSYLTKEQMYFEVMEVHNKYSALVESFRSRGYALNNIVKLRTAAIENDII